MTQKPPTIGKITIIAQKFNETVAFYQLLGLDIPNIFSEPSDTRHAVVNNRHYIGLIFRSGRYTVIPNCYQRQLN
jgi:hypothetical protein